MKRRGFDGDPAQLLLFDPRSELPGRPPLWRWSWLDGELLCFDLETTGVNRFVDVPVSFALVRLRAGEVCERRVALVNPGRPVPAEATGVHGITDELARRGGMPLRQAVDEVADQLVEASRRGVPTVGVKLDFDLTMLDVLCRTLDGRGLRARGWRGPALDALVLDRHVDPYRHGHRRLGDLCALYGVPIDRAHSAECDAEAAGRVILSMAARYEELADSSLGELYVTQIESHREWVLSFNAWRQGRGLAPLQQDEEIWPVARTSEGEAGAA